MFAIYKREMRAYFTSPIGYIFMAIFLAVNGLLFAMFTTMASTFGNTSSVSGYFMYLIFAYVIILPLLTMKLFSEERKMRTEQLLLTAPVSLYGMVLAKFFAAFSMFFITYLASCINFFALFEYGTPNAAILFGNTLGIILIAAACIAIGVFISALTENQLVAAIATMGVLLLFVGTTMFNQYIDSYLVRSVISWFCILDRYNNFLYGCFDINAIVYYLSISFVFLFLTVRVYEKRRWS